MIVKLETIELTVDAIITDVSLPEQSVYTSNDLPKPISCDTSPCILTIAVKEPYTKELYEALVKLFESNTLQITFKNEPNSTIQK